MTCEGMSTLRHFHLVKFSALFFTSQELIAVVHHQMAFSLCENPWSLINVRILIVHQAPRILTEKERLFGGEQ